MIQENFEKSERDSEKIKLFEKAVKVFLEGRDEYSNIEMDDELSKNVRQGEILNFAKNLFTSSENASRIDSPGWGKTKLAFDDENREFSIQANGMNEEDYQKWQKFIGKKFEENGLKFYYFK